MKSYVSDLLEVAICIYRDAVAKCTAVTLDDRDIDTLTSRVKHEGLSFLTITLPSLGKELDKSLALGMIDPTFFRSFKKKAKAPALLQGFFDRVFHEDGRIRNEPSIQAIEGIRQIAYAFKKLEVPCTPRRVRRALDKFIGNEQVFDEPVALEDQNYFSQVSHCLWYNTFGNEDSSLLLNVIPRHGPGATAERIAGNGKFKIRRWHERLEPYFPVLENAFANADARLEPEFQKVTLVEEDGEQPVRVIPVPKTLKTPRIIAIEPVCMQYTQQALAEAIVDRLERHELTSGHVNFRDQGVNRAKAISSSKDGRFATLDLSSASDLVPYELAISMFDGDPDLMDAIKSCRSTRAQMPDGTIIPLRKFASMGSALCFPVEAMYFYTICVAALLRRQNLPVTYRNALRVSRQVYVYGDDILVPTHLAEVVIDHLHKYCCKVNVDKSFTMGKFRESCGMDAFDGEAVTPTYIRQKPPNDKRDAKAIVSWVSASNHLYKRGYWLTSAILLKRVESIIGTLPIVGNNCGGLGKSSFQNVVSIDRWGKRLQRPEVRTWAAQPVYRKDRLNGNSALLKCLLRLERGPDDSAADPFRYARPVGFTMPTPVDARHLERTARHGAFVLKRRWLSPG